MSELWDNPLFPIDERLAMAKGGIEYRDNIIANLRERIAGLETIVKASPQHWKESYNTDPVQRACGELPEGWELQACMELHAGWVDLYTPTGEKIHIDSQDTFNWTIHAAIDHALEATKPVEPEPERDTRTIDMLSEQAS